MNKPELKRLSTGSSGLNIKSLGEVDNGRRSSGEFSEDGKLNKSGNLYTKKHGSPHRQMSGDSSRADTPESRGSLRRVQSNKKESPKRLVSGDTLRTEDSNGTGRSSLRHSGSLSSNLPTNSPDSEMKHSSQRGRRSDMMRAASGLSRTSSQTSSGSDDDDESQAFTEEYFGMPSSSSRGSFTLEDDDSVFSRLSDDSFSIEDKELDTTQYVALFI